MFGKNKDDDRSKTLEKVNSALRSAESGGVRDLSVRDNGGVIEIHGTANSIPDKQEAFRKITDAAGDAAGVVNKIQITQVASGNPAAHAGSPSPAPPGMRPGTGGSGRTHVVKQGETLSGIAQHYYGKASEYHKIFEANRDQVKDPDMIREGMTLNIPA